MIKEQSLAFEGRGVEILFLIVAWKYLLYISTHGRNALIFYCCFGKFIVFPPIGMYVILLNELMKHDESTYQFTY